MLPPVRFHRLFQVCPALLRTFMLGIRELVAARRAQQAPQPHGITCPCRHAVEARGVLVGGALARATACELELDERHNPGLLIAQPRRAETHSITAEGAARAGLEVGFWRHAHSTVRAKRLRGGGQQRVLLWRCKGGASTT